MAENRSSVARSSLNFLRSRCGASNRTQSDAQDTYLSQNGSTSIRMADSTQERIKKHIDAHSFLDTTPNADINMTWHKQCRRRNAELEVGPPAMRYSCRNHVERLHEKIMKDPVSSEVVMMERKSLTRLQKFNNAAHSMRRLQNIGSPVNLLGKNSPKGAMQRL